MAMWPFNKTDDNSDNTADNTPYYTSHTTPYYTNWADLVQVTPAKGDKEETELHNVEVNILELLSLLKDVNTKKEKEDVILGFFLKCLSQVEGYDEDEVDKEYDELVEFFKTNFKELYDSNKTVINTFIKVNKMGD